MSEEIKSWDDVEDENLVMKFFKSEEFREAFRKRVEADTWGKGLPMIYMDEDRWIVKHWQDGRIERIKKVEE